MGIKPNFSSNTVTSIDSRHPYKIRPMNIGTHSHYTQGSVYISSYTHNSVMIYTRLLSS